MKARKVLQRYLLDVEFCSKPFYKKAVYLDYEGINMLNIFGRRIEESKIKCKSNAARQTRAHRNSIIAIDVAEIAREDERTTFMIKNISNKYTQRMLLETFDATHKGQYDYIYLKIDFNNRCNVGYAFVNFVDTNAVLSFIKSRVEKTHLDRKIPKQQGVMKEASSPTEA
ncbi:7148_t:CDS:2 [Ambispora gerdemannii]|uniref:7148_t:CDS:1 n=1 Tax=Ambispora gerdemannii TaxID=144530 RepID=A0A9N9CPI7_9GLOM|nr:7148_t:CDS:2 [Ambispora gerdemannii]